jgi:hypothetical protein
MSRVARLGKMLGMAMVGWCRQNDGADLSIAAGSETS